MRSNSRCVIVSFILTLALSAQAATTIKYAAPGGTGAGTSWSDTAELRTLLAATASPAVGDTIEIWVAAGTYTPTATTTRTISFVLKNRVELYGGFSAVEKMRSQRNPQANLTVLSGEIGSAASETDNSQHVLTASNCDTSAVLDGFTVRDGYSDGYGGGIENTSASPSLLNCRFVNNKAVWGGAISNRAGSAPVITSCVFEDNVVSSKAGAIINENSSPAISYCTFSRNIAGLQSNVVTRAGALQYENSQCDLIGCSFIGNKGADGAAVYIGDECNIAVRNCTFDSNTFAFSTMAGGTLYCVYDCTVTVEDCIFNKNVCGMGGGIESSGTGPITVTRCTFTENTATTAFGGGAIWHYFHGKMTLSDSTFTNNKVTANAGGGAIGTGQAEIEINNCVFTGNSCPQRGGAIDASDESILTVNGSTFKDNTAGYGGAMAHGYENTTVRVYNSLFDGNSATEGGAILNVNAGMDFAAVNCTFVNNSANAGVGGVVSNRSSPSVFTNCIFWGNTANVSPLVYGGGATITCSCVQGGFAGTGNISTDPLFLLKAPGVYRLRPTSPCIDAALGTGAPTLDGLGKARVDLPDVTNTGSGSPAFVDMGAFERQPVTVTLTPASIAENAAIGTSTGTVGGQGSDLAAPFFFELVGGAGSTDNALFLVDGLSLISAAAFDFETKTSYSVRVRLTDDNATSFEAAFTVAVSNVNEAPTALGLSANVLPENSAIGTTVGALSSTDNDVGDTFTYSLVSGVGDQQNAFFTIDGATLKSAAALDYEARSGYSIRVRSTDAGGLSFDAVKTVTITDVPDIIPQFDSGPSYSPNIIVIGQTVTFSCVASNAASYAWNFGDGSTGQGPSATHAFAAAGIYTATVTLTSPDGVAISKTVALTVNLFPNDPNADPDNDGLPNNVDPDSDNDGFSNVIETAVGSDPFSATSTPNGAGATPGQSFPLILTKLAIRLSFTDAGRDSIQLRGIVDVPGGFTVANQKCFVDVGGVVRAFTLSEKGKAGTSSESLKLSVKKKKSLVPAQAAPFQINLKNGTFASTLTDEGLTNETTRAKSVNVPVTFLFNGQEFRKTQPQSYSAKAGSSGKTK